MPYKISKLKLSNISHKIKYLTFLSMIFSLFKKLMKIISLIFCFILGALILYNAELSPEVYTLFIDNYLKNIGFFGVLLYILMCATLICFAVPRQFIAFLSGYTFTFSWGFVYATSACLLACILCFYYARYIGQDFVKKKFNNKFKRMNSYLKDNTFFMALTLRLLPLGSNLIISLLAGVTKIKAKPFFLGSVLGYMPQSLIFALLGSGVQLEESTNFAISFILLICVSILSCYLYKKYKNHLFLNEDEKTS